MAVEVRAVFESHLAVGYLLSGGCPPRYAMPDAMRTMSDLDPVTHVTTIVLFAALGGVGLVVAAALFRWE